MELFLRDNNYKYAVEQIMLMLFPEERPVYPEKPSGALMAEVSVHRSAKFACAGCTIAGGGTVKKAQARVKLRGEDPIVLERLTQRAVKLAFYRAGTAYIGKKPVWGALSGIRPGKLMTDLLEQGLSDKRAVREFVRLYDAAPERAALCLDTAHASLEMRAELRPGDVCLYLGVPFCPTRCSYCSFVSQSVERSMSLIPGFLDALGRDIEATARALREAGLRVISVYFGGGTPTTLRAEQLGRVCERLEACIDLSSVREFTVEAGRPDTITDEKLAVLRSHGVTRVSVNPQTMQDRVLEAIGRRHTAQDVVDALRCVRRSGGFEVNMDLIAGLPEDSAVSFRDTLRRVIDLGPENITVHTLALKKGSRITLDGTRLPDAAEVGRMLDDAQELLRAAGYEPYYLYRQKFMSGGFENVGWCRKGCKNAYNICIMEELCSIISLGAGASTKLVTGSGRIERFFAPKYPLEYINGIDRVCADKSKIVDFYRRLKNDTEKETGR